RPAARTAECPGPRPCSCHESGPQRGEPSWATCGDTAPAPWLPLLSCFLPGCRSVQPSCPWSPAAALSVVLLVALESPRRNELAELVTDHRLGDEHRDVLAAVMHCEGEAEEVRRDDRTARPGLDDVLGALVVLD